MSEGGPSIIFHTGVHDPVLHGLRVLRKSLSQGLGVLVLGPPDTINLIDDQLWTAEPGSFVPHVSVTAPPDGHTPDHIPGHLPDSAAWRLSPVWLLAHEGEDEPVLPSGRPVLLNLGCPAPAKLQGCSRIVEVVGASPQARALGQSRWRAYRARGHNPSHHAV